MNPQPDNRRALFAQTILHFWRSDRSRANLALAMSALLGAAEYLEPYLFGRVVQLLTDMSESGQPTNWSGIAAAWIALVIALMLGTRTMSLAAQDVAQEGARNLWIRYVRALYENLSDIRGRRAHPERVLKVGISGTNAGSELWQAFSQEQFQTVAGILIVLPAAFLLNPALALILVILVSVSFALLYFNVRRTTSAEEEIEALEGGVAERASDLIRHKSLILTSSATEREVSAFNALLMSLRGRYHSVARTWASVAGTIRCVFSLAMFLMLVAGVWLHQRRLCDIGEIVTFVSVIGYVLAKVEMLIDGLRRTSSRMPALAEFCALSGANLATGVDARTAPRKSTAHTASSEPAGCADQGEYLSLRGVGFEYRPDDPVLTSLDLEISRGEILRISGQSGIGKTTLMHLLLGLLQPSRGAITYRGQDLRSIPLESWWERISVVFQDSHLLSRSIEDNLRLGNPGAEREDIERVTRVLGLHDLILQLEDGYGTLVGDIGRRFSGGQRQLLSIARALLAAPEILLLDEPTSNLDPASEQSVLRALESLRERCTIVLISHRQSTLQIATRSFKLGKSGDGFARGP